MKYRRKTLFDYFLERIKSYKDFYNPIMIFASSAAFFSVAYVLNLRNNSGNFEPRSISQLQEHLPVIITISLIFGLLFYWYTTRNYLSRYLCMSCGKYRKQNSTDKSCKCGGEYEAPQKLIKLSKKETAR